jgi:hypothetical protein
MRHDKRVPQHDSATNELLDRARAVLRDLANGVPLRRRRTRKVPNVTDLLVELAPEIERCRTRGVSVPKISEALREGVRIDFADRTIWRALDQAKERH